jgi:uncharacterized protein (TIGR03085 family)
MTRYARSEREGIADELLATDPDAPTLCAGWAARDLAAHLVTRERRPDAGPGILLTPFAGWTDRVRDRYRDRYPYPELIEMIRKPGALSLLRIPQLDELVTPVEFFVHREDIRRAREEWLPRELDAGFARMLWRRVPTLSKPRLRRVPGNVTVEAPGFGSFRAGVGPAVTLTGDPGELLLYFFGRRQAARIEVTGADELVERLRGQRN